MLNPTRLSLLVSLDSLGTVRAVAGAASMSASAVSQQLSVLEGEAGIELFERHGRHLRLTPAGKLLATRGVEILDRIASAEDELRGWRGTSGVVRVGAFSSALSSFVIEAAGAVEREHADLRVSLREFVPAQTVSALAGGEIDIAIIGDYGSGSTPYPAGIQQTPLATDQVVVIFPADHSLAGRPVSFEQLRDERWLVDGTDLEDEMIARCRQAGLEPAISGRLNGHRPLMQAVAAGLGVTVLPALAVEPLPGLVASPLKPDFTRELTLLVRPEAARRKSIEVTREAILEAARRQVDRTGRPQASTSRSRRDAIAEP